jgi:quinol monooxygenase YgiN
MIQHIVLLKLRPGTTDAEVAAAFEAGSALTDQVPGIAEFAFGRDRSHPERGFDLASIMQFTDRAALEGYLEHPARTRYLAEHVTPMSEQRIEVDIPAEGVHRPTESLIASWYWAGSSSALEEVLALDRAQ